jgi:hypothetical protein
MPAMHFNTSSKTVGVKLLRTGMAGYGLTRLGAVAWDVVGIVWFLVESVDAH